MSQTLTSGSISYVKWSSVRSQSLCRSIGTYLWARSSPLFPQHNPGCFLPSQFSAQLCRACPWARRSPVLCPSPTCPQWQLASLLLAGLSGVAVEAPGLLMKQILQYAPMKHKGKVRSSSSTATNTTKPPALSGPWGGCGGEWGVGQLRRPQGSGVGVAMATPAPGRSTLPAHWPTNGFTWYK